MTARRWAPLYGVVLGAETGLLVSIRLYLEGFAFSGRDIMIAVLFAAIMTASATAAWILAGLLLLRRAIVQGIALPICTLLIFLPASAVIFYFAMVLAQPGAFEPLLTRHGLMQRMWSVIANLYFFSVFGLRLVWPEVILLTVATGLGAGALAQKSQRN